MRRLAHQKSEMKFSKYRNPLIPIELAECQVGLNIVSNSFG